VSASADAATIPEEGDPPTGAGKHVQSKYKNRALAQVLVAPAMIHFQASPLLNALLAPPRWAA
jgi:hypothetical protein